MNQHIQKYNLHSRSSSSTLLKTYLLITGRLGTAGPTQSPGRALQDIKAKLNQHAKPQQPPAMDGGDAMSKSNALNNKDVQNQPVQAPMFENASAEVADIDQRLHALQTFLRAAKAGGPPGKVV